MVSSRDVAGTERDTVDAYATLERELIGGAASAVAGYARRPGLPQWAALSRYRQRARNLVGQLVSRAVGAARQAVTAGARIGQAAATRDLKVRRLPVIATPAPETLTDVTARQVVESIQATVPRMLTATDQLYQDTVAAIAANPAASEAARLRTAQTVLDELTANGITGFVDRAGRHWNVVSYIEMLTRTAATKAAVDAHVATLTANGQDLVVVSYAQHCCDRCAPFEGQVLSITGLTSSAGDVPVLCSLDAARGAGLFHPNCRHRLSLYVPGDALPEPVPANPEGYRHTQQLRALERAVRASKRRRAAAVTPQAARAANARTRALQAQIRAHVAQTGVTRKRRREQIGRAL